MRMTVFKKIRSRKGASITFALLAFLVCAVIGSVVLSAAIASSGRVSGLAEMDQRYYAVTSAAQLFSDALDGQSYTIERIHVSNVGEEHDYGKTTSGETHEIGPGRTNLAPADSDAYPVNSYTNRITIRQAETDPITSVISPTTKNTSFLTEAALYYVMQDKTGDDAWKEKPGHAKSWSLELSTEDENLKALQVDVTAEMAANGTINLTFINHNDKDTKPFSIILVMKASIVDNSDHPNVSTVDHVSVSPITSAGYEEAYTETTITTKTETKTTEIKWTVAEIRKVGA